ncbi:MAG: alginate export family protein [Deltaproteobacteria bacterium]|nr:alginate export family protein [Deltaproteobacteria bacterium]
MKTLISLMVMILLGAGVSPAQEVPAAPKGPDKTEAASASPAPSPEGEALSWGDTLKAGTPTFQLRLSYETSDVDDAKKSKPARGFTARTRVGFRSGTYQGIRFYVQMQDVSAMLKDYATERPGYDPIADPAGVAVQQGYVEYAGIEDTSLKAGRQELVLDDHRLIGNVDWRQNGQSFDGAVLTSSPVKNLTLTLGHIWRVKTIFNTLVDLNGLDVFEVQVKDMMAHTISLYGYWLDSTGNTPADRDIATTGMRVSAKWDVARYELEYAAQSKYADNKTDGGTMTNGFVEGTVMGVSLGVGKSLISEKKTDKKAFDTLFSTAHKFNGWSDQFLATNGGGLKNGLDDGYAQIGGKIGPVTWLAKTHVFRQTIAAEPYGKENNYLVSMPITPTLTGLLKYAEYTPDPKNLTGVANVKEKTGWARLEYKF